MKKRSKKKSKKDTRPLTEVEIRAIVNARKNSSMSADSAGNDLSARRQNNLKRYMGAKYGDERTGQSQVVTRECLEAVEWSIPSLMRIFASSEKVVEFRPIGKDDEDAAKQETQYVNHVYSKENDGFSTTYTWIKSILMNPIGYVKAYWEEGEETTIEEYHGLFPPGIKDLADQEGMEAIEAEETTVEVDQDDGSVVSMPCYSVKFERTIKTGRLVVEPVPPEELSVSGNLNKVSLQGCDYLCHSTTPTRSELIDRGYPETLVNDLPIAGTKTATSTEKSNRHQVTVGSDGDSDEATDRSTERVQVDEHYLYIDTTGDGRAEYRMITVSGEHILENDEINDHPFVSGCAVPVPFSHVGLAWQELVEDLQKIYTTLTRQFLNNLYRTNNPRTIVGRGVNISDVVNDLPNAPIRAKNIDNIRIEPTQSVVGNIAPAFEMLGHMKESRTGVSRVSMGLDADALARVANGAFYASLEQANQRLEMLARIIAEMSFKPLFLKIHKILLTHQIDKKEVKLSGEWIPVNPSEWRDRKDMDVMVGLGSGNKQAQAAALAEIMKIQEKLKMSKSPMVTDQNIFKSLQQLVFLAGLPNPEAYFTDPDKAQPQQQGQGQGAGDDGMGALAAAQMEMAKVEREKANMEHEAEIFKLKQEAKKDSLDHQTTIAKLQLQLAESDRKLGQGDRKLDIDEFKAETDVELGSAKLMQEDDKIDLTQTQVFERNDEN
jgi:hypothetical protein